MSPLTLYCIVILFPEPSGRYFKLCLNQSDSSFKTNSPKFNRAFRRRAVSPASFLLPQAHPPSDPRRICVDWWIARWLQSHYVLTGGSHDGFSLIMCWLVDCTMVTVSLCVVWWIARWFQSHYVLTDGSHDGFNLIQHSDECNLPHLIADDISRHQWTCALTSALTLKVLFAVHQSSLPLLCFRFWGKYAGVHCLSFVRNTATINHRNR